MVPTSVIFPVVKLIEESVNSELKALHNDLSMTMMTEIGTLTTEKKITDTGINEIRKVIEKQTGFSPVKIKLYE